jgi:chaperonin GroEL
MTIKLKLDDAIGAVKCAIDSGIVLGGGKALYNLSFDFPKLTKVLQAPLNTIINNAGIKINKKIRKVLNKNDLIGIDVKDGTLVNLLNVGIIDSYQSIDNALINSSSIASNYLRGYTLIKKV